MKELEFESEEERQKYLKELKKHKRKLKEAERYATGEYMEYPPEKDYE